MLPGHSLTPIFPRVESVCETGPCPGYPHPPGNGTPATSQSVVSSIVLPNSKQYSIYYDEYLEVARIKNPLGSYVDYEYSGWLRGADADGYFEWGFSAGTIGRRIASVKNFDETGQLISQKTFSHPPQYATPSLPALDNVTIEVKDSSGTSLAKSKHYFYDTVGSLGGTWRAGKEFKTEILDPITNTVLRNTDKTWERRAPFQWCSGILQYYTCGEANWPGSSPPVDPRVTEVKTTLETGQVTKKTFLYDQYNNITDTYEYDFGTGQAGQFLRRSHTDYVTDSNYTSHTGADSEKGCLRKPGFRRMPAEITRPL